MRGEKIDLTVVGPEDPLAAGIVDEFDRAGLRIFGPTKAAAQLEASKAFAKAVMREAGVPTASFEVFDEAEPARRWVRARGGAMVVKADGLALGKGVVVCEDAAAALAAIDDAMERRRFGAAGARVVIEERLKGEELSFFALCDGENAIALGLVQDHKAVFDGDRGPNTGGMGAYTPVPHFGSGVRSARDGRGGAADARRDARARHAVSRRAVRGADGRRRANQRARVQRALRRS